MTLTRIDPAAAVRLARADLPRPLDVLNLIHLGDERSYARYGVAVTPAMMAVGARLQWMGAHEQALLGERQAERLIVVRYPSQRRFLAMTLNPYYVAINRWRERGVRRFEASFTDPHERPLELRSQRRLLVAHFEAPTTLEQVRRALEPQAGPLVYASRRVASASVLRGSRPTDPNLLSYEHFACFAVGEELALEAPALDRTVLQLYRRADPRALVRKAR